MPLTKRTFITDDFLHRIGDEGALAKAAERIGNSFTDTFNRLPRMTTWSLICEEIVDTEHQKSYYERVVNELFGRGLTAPEIRDMRIFAWKTAGWLNFEMMLWDWVSLDENDILRAVMWLRRRRELTRQSARSMKEYVERYTGDGHGPEPDASQS